MQRASIGIVNYAVTELYIRVIRLQLSMALERAALRDVLIPNLVIH
jgi:hypothetical protein